LLGRFQVSRGHTHVQSIFPPPLSHTAPAFIEKGPHSRRDRTQASLATRLERPSPTVWLSGQEAAEYVGVSWPTLRALIREHAIPHVRLGRCWRIDVAILDAHLRQLAEQEAGATS
jgi:excisionase family DNA binding protein